MASGADKILKILLEIKSQQDDLNRLVNGLTNVKKVTDDAAKSGFGLRQAFEFAGANEVIHRIVETLKQIPEQFVESIKKGIEWRAELQQIQNGIAGILRQSQGARFIDFQAAKDQAGNVVELLKKSANELGIEYAVMFESFTSSSTAMANAGVTKIKDQIALVTMLQRALTAVGVTGFTQVRDLQDILIGQAARTKGGRELGFKDEEIKAAIDSGKAMEFFTEKTAGFMEAGRAQAQGFTGDLNRLHNAVLDLQGETAQPLMAPLADAIQTLNKDLTSDDMRAGLRTLGQEIGTLVGIFTTLGKAVSGADGNMSKFLATTGALIAGPLGAAVGFVTGKAQESRTAENKEIIGLQDFEKRLRLLRDSAETARTIAEQEKTAADTDKFISEIQEKIVSGGTKHVAQWQELLGLLREFRNNLAGIYGTAAEIPKKAEDQSKQLEAIRAIRDDIALKQAAATNDPWTIATAQAQVAFDRALKSLTDKGVLDKEAVELAKEEYVATYNQVLAIESKKNAQRDFNTLAREEAATLRENRLQQQLINQDPFMSPDAKASALIPLLVQERNEILKLIQARLADIEVQKLQHGPEAEARIQQSIDKIRELSLELQLVGQKAQTLSFSGGLQKELADWVNNFGTAAQQIGRFIEGSINGALQTTNQLLIDAAFRTGDWRQDVVNLEKSVINMFLTMLEQMALQQAASLLGITTTTTAQVASGGAIATAHAPAAAATSISSYGVAALIGEVAAIAAIIAIMAALGGGFRKGGYTGDGDEGEFAGPAHRKEFVFDAAATRSHGIENLELARRGQARIIPHFATGGEVDFDPNLTPEAYGRWVPGGGIEPGWLPGNLRGGAPPDATPPPSNDPRGNYAVSPHLYPPFDAQNPWDPTQSNPSTSTGPAVVRSGPDVDIAKHGDRTPVPIHLNVSAGAGIHPIGYIGPVGGGIEYRPPGTDNTGLIGYSGPPSGTPGFAGSDPGWNSYNNWLATIMGGYPGGRPDPSTNVYDITGEVSGGTYYNSVTRTWQRWDENSFRYFDVPGPGVTGTAGGVAGLPGGVSGNLFANLPPGSVVVGHDATTGAPVYRAPSGQMYVAPQEAGGRGGGNAGNVPGGGASYYSGTYFNYGTGHYDHLHDPNLPGGGAANALKMSAEQQSFSPVKVGMNPTGDGGRSVNTTGPWQMRHVDPATAAFLHTWSAAHTSVFQPGMLPHHATGARIPGPPSTTDSLLAWLATGEGVINAPAMQFLDRYHGGQHWLDDLNNMRIPIPRPRFAAGGRAGATSAGASREGGSSALGKVNIAIFDDRNHAAKWLESQDGQKMIIDAVNNSRHELGLGAVN